MPAAERDLEDDPGPSSCLGPLSCIPVEVEEEDFGSGLAGPATFATWRLWRPLLFDNEASDARDHCANERSKGFISYHLVIFPLCLLIKFLHFLIITTQTLHPPPLTVRDQHVLVSQVSEP